MNHVTTPRPEENSLCAAASAGAFLASENARPQNQPSGVGVNSVSQTPFAPHSLPSEPRLAFSDATAAATNIRVGPPHASSVEDAVAMKVGVDKAATVMTEARTHRIGASD